MGNEYDLRWTPGRIYEMEEISNWFKDEYHGRFMKEKVGGTETEWFRERLGKRSDGQLSKDLRRK